MLESFGVTVDVALACLDTENFGDSGMPVTEALGDDGCIGREVEFFIELMASVSLMSTIELLLIGAEVAKLHGTNESKLGNKLVTGVWEISEVLLLDALTAAKDTVLIVCVWGELTVAKWLRVMLETVCSM